MLLVINISFYFLFSFNTLKTMYLSIYLFIFQPNKKIRSRLKVRPNAMNRDHKTISGLALYLRYNCILYLVSRYSSEKYSISFIVVLF